MTDTPRRPRIAIGSDHAGYELKQHLVTMLLGQGYAVDDQCTHSTESVDYPAICAGVGLAEEIVETFLTTDFEGGRHARRVDQITELEAEF